MLNRAATDAALNPKRGAPKRATGQQIAFLPAGKEYQDHQTKCEIGLLVVRTLHYY